MRPRTKGPLSKLGSLLSASDRRNHSRKIRLLYMTSRTYKPDCGAFRKNRMKCFLKWIRQINERRRVIRFQLKSRSKYSEPNENRRNLRVQSPRILAAMGPRCSRRWIWNEVALSE